MSAEAELREKGYCVLRGHFPPALIDACREAFWPVLEAYLAVHAGASSNRGSHRHYLPMPFNPPCFALEFFFDRTVLELVHSLMDDRAVVDQWGCDVPLLGSEYQEQHIDYRRPLFPEAPSLVLPIYMLMVSFGLVPITAECGPIEIDGQAVLLDIGDVLIRHPWTLHRGTPNTTTTPRALASIRYVRRWYVDDSREVNSIPRAVWESLKPAQQALLRFPRS